MNKIHWLFIVFLCCSCGENKNKINEQTAFAKDNAAGKVEIYDAAALNCIDSSASIEIIARGFTWCEGPLWVAGKQMLLFSDVPENKIYMWNAGDSAKVFLTPSGYESAQSAAGKDGSNGLALDKDGNLLLCQSGNRQVARLKAGFDSPKPVFTILASTYNGKKFNSPNDIVADSRNNIYFTDPVYGLPEGEHDPSRELKMEGVYKIDANGKLILLVDSISRPNGIALSNDEQVLYIASSDDNHPAWFAYRFDENRNIKSGGKLLDATSMKEKATVKQGADGFKVDKYGNIFSSGPDGINIISPSGKLLALIKIYNRPTSNCAFNETKDVLYVTADDVVLRIKLHS